MADHRRDPRYVSGYRRYPSPLRQTTSALTMKIVLLAAIATLAIGGLIAVQMAAGSDPTLGPKAAARAKKAASTASQSGSSSSSGTGSGNDGYYYGDSSGSSGSSSSGGSSGYSYSPPPVTSSTS